MKKILHFPSKMIRNKFFINEDNDSEFHSFAFSPIFINKKQKKEYEAIVTPS